MCQRHWYKAVKWERTDDFLSQFIMPARGVGNTEVPDCIHRIIVGCRRWCANNYYMAVINVKCVYAHALFRMGCPVPVDSELERGTLAGLSVVSKWLKWIPEHWLASVLGRCTGQNRQVVPGISSLEDANNIEVSGKTKNTDLNSTLNLWCFLILIHYCT